MHRYIMTGNGENLAPQSREGFDDPGAKKLGIQGYEQKLEAVLTDAINKSHQSGYRRRGEQVTKQAIKQINTLPSRLQKFTEVMNNFPVITFYRQSDTIQDIQASKMAPQAIKEELPQLIHEYKDHGDSSPRLNMLNSAYTQKAIQQYGKLFQQRGIYIEERHHLEELPGGLKCYPLLYLKDTERFLKLLDSIHYHDSDEHHEIRQAHLGTILMGISHQLVYSEVEATRHIREEVGDIIDLSADIGVGKVNDRDSSYESIFMAADEGDLEEMVVYKDLGFVVNYWHYEDSWADVVMPDFAQKIIDILLDNTIKMVGPHELEQLSQLYKKMARIVNVLRDTKAKYNGKRVFLKARADLLHGLNCILQGLGNNDNFLDKELRISKTNDLYKAILDI